MYETDKIVTLESYYDPMLAEIVRGRLEAEGISCFIADGNVVSAQPLYNNAVGGIKIKVFERDLEKCREVIVRDNAEVLLPDAEYSPPDHTCPFCHSTNIRYGAATTRKTNWLVFAVSLLLTVYPFYARKAWHCFNCGKDFK